MTPAAVDRAHMVRALELAARGLATVDPNPRVGCVIVRDGEVVGEGWHERAGEAHAEVHALAAAGDRARGATAYVTLEPCCHHGRTPPCTDALIAAGVVRVIYGAGDPNPRVDGGGERLLREAGIDVEGGVLAAESAALNVGFMTRMRSGRPWVRSKLAVSLDGRTALADGRSRWITGPAARRDVQRWRARSSAIVTGVGTVLADDPLLTVREPADTARQPLRVILDPGLRTPPGARLLTEGGQVLVVAARDDGGRRQALESAGARVEVLTGGGPRIDLPALLNFLAGLGTNEVLVEAGEELNGALLAGRHIDELIVYQAPHVLGSTARGMFAMPMLEDMKDRPAFRLHEVRSVGDDLRMIYRKTTG